MSHLSGNGFTTLSDTRDPKQASVETPGGLIEDVSVSYGSSGDVAMSTSDMRDWVRSSSAEDSVLTSTIEGVQRQVERQYGLALVEQTVTVIVSGPAREVALPRVPGNTLTSVKEFDNGETQSDESADYYLLKGALKAKKGWAIGNTRLEVVYDAGYTDAPKDLQLALKRKVADHFDRRSDIQVDVQVETLPGAESIFRRYANQNA